MTTPDTFRNINGLQRTFRFCVMALVLMLFTLIVLSRLGLKSVSDFLPMFYFRRQDIWLAAIILFSWLKLSSGLGSQKPNFGQRSRLSAFRYAPTYLAIGLFAICYAGHHLLLGGYDASRDEQMATFDGLIFAHGRLAWPMDQNWRDVAPALNQLFILPIGRYEAWVSAYLPVNAGVRAIFSFIGDQSFASPFFVALGAISLWRISAKIWPKRKDIGWLCLILYAGSGQILVNGMTSYAMSGHLALNLLWFWLFLINRRSTDFAALVVGFLATGMHQPLFHPLFAVPVLTILVIQRDWTRAVIYLLGYALICAFWLYWPIAISNLAVVSDVITGTGVDFQTRLFDAVNGISLGSIMLMFANIFRFAVWQHLLLIPILAIGVHSVWKAKEPLAVALGISFGLPIAVMLILLPYQGHGFGYRYLHPVLGNAIILAGYGWHAVGPKLARQKLLVVTSLITFVLLIPVQFYFAHSFYAPWISVDRAISKSKADIALIDTDSAPFAGDIVLNRPDLLNRPVRLGISALASHDYAKLCRSHPQVITVGPTEFAPVIAYFGVKPLRDNDLMTQAIIEARRAGCVVN